MAKIDPNYLAQGKQQVSEPVLLSTSGKLFDPHAGLVSTGGGINMPDIGNPIQVPFIPKGTDIGARIGEFGANFGSIIVEHAIKKADMDARIRAKETATEKMSDLYSMLYNNPDSLMFKTGKAFIDAAPQLRQMIDRKLGEGTDNLSEAEQQYYVSEIHQVAKELHQKVIDKQVTEGQKWAQETLDFEYDTLLSTIMPEFGNYPSFQRAMGNVIQYRMNTHGESLEQSYNKVYTDTITRVLDIPLAPIEFSSLPDFTDTGELAELIHQTDISHILLSSPDHMRDMQELTFDNKTLIQKALEDRFDKIADKIKQYHDTINDVESIQQDNEFKKMAPEFQQNYNNPTWVNQQRARLQTEFGVSGITNFNTILSIYESKSDTDIIGHSILFDAYTRHTHPSKLPTLINNSGATLSKESYEKYISAYYDPTYSLVESDFKRDIEPIIDSFYAQAIGPMSMTTSMDPNIIAELKQVKHIALSKLISAHLNTKDKDNYTIVKENLIQSLFLSDEYAFNPIEDRLFDYLNRDKGPWTVFSAVYNPKTNKLNEQTTEEDIITIAKIQRNAIATEFREENSSLTELEAARKLSIISMQEQFAKQQLQKMSSKKSSSTPTNKTESSKPTSIQDMSVKDFFKALMQEPTQVSEKTEQ